MSKTWIIAGAAVGLAIPLVLRVYEILQFGHVRPAVLCLFWPTSFVAAFNEPHAPWMVALAVLANTLVFGTVAGILRRAFPVALAALLIAAWVFLPPSNAALRRRFDQQQAILQQLAEMSKSDSDIVRITFDQFETGDDKTHGIGDAVTLLPNQRWSEYRNLLGALQMQEAMFRRAGNGELYVAAQTFGVGRLRSYYGYLYCSKISARPSVYVPCMEGRDSADRNAYGYEALGSNWYIYKVFRLYDIE
jgi:hypothetical protein